MRFAFKTSYRQDMGLFRDNVQRNWYAALLVGLLVLPFLVPSYLVDISLVFIYGLCGLSLMVLAGYTGLVSLGHAAFLGIGAYAHVYFSQDLGVPWVLSVALAAMITAGAGVLVGLPALRMTGVYLTIATLAFALIIQEVLSHWEAVTGGLKGKAVAKAVIFGFSFGGGAAFYFLCLAFLAGGLWLTQNLLSRADGPGLGGDPGQRDRGPVDGGQPRRVQDDRLRLLGGADGGRGRALRAQDRLPRPGHLHGAPVDPVPVDGRGGRPRQPARRAVRRGLRRAPARADLGGPGLRAGLLRPGRIIVRRPGGQRRRGAVDRFVKQPALEPGVFGLILVFIILFEPLGIYGRWMKLKLYFSLFPLYKRATFKRQKTYMRSERLR